MRLGRTVWLVGLTSLLTDAGSEMIFPLLPMFLVGSLGGSPAALGLIEGAADTVAGLLKPVAGRISDRAGRRKPLILGGYALASLARPLVTFAAAPWHVLAIRVADRIGKGLRSAPRDALLAAAAPPGAEGRAFGLHRAMDHAGALIGPLIAAALLGAGLELRQVFALALIPGLLACLMVALIREPAPVIAPDPATAPATVPATAPDIPLPPRLRQYLAILLLFSLGNASDAFLLLRAQESGVEAAALPALWAAFHAAKVGCTWAGGHAADRLPRAWLLIAGLAIYAGAYAGFSLVDSPAGIAACFGVYALYYGLSEPTEKAMIRDLAPAAARGRAYGWYQAIGGLSALPAGLICGLLWDRVGAWAALGLGAGLAGIAALLMARWAIQGQPLRPRGSPQ